MNEMKQFEYRNKKTIVIDRNTKKSKENNEKILMYQ